MSTLTSLPTRRQPLLVAEPGVRFGLANAALVAALLTTGAVGASPRAALVVVLVVAATASLGLDLAWSAAVAGCGWALFTGFSEHAFGRLTATYADLGHLALLLAACALPAVLLHRGRRHE